MIALLDEAGYPSVVATNCDQAYHRYVRLGERLAVSARLVDVTGPKRTALGEGWFVTTRSTWTSAGEPVATMDFRVLKYPPPWGELAPWPPRGKPPASPSPWGVRGSPRPGIMRPVTSPDTEFFWAGTAAGELRVQRCERLRRAAPPARPDVPVLRDHEPRRATSSRPGPARSTATSCTITRPCPARSCRS